MVEPGADDVHVLLVAAQGLGNLGMAVLHAVAQAQGGHAAVLVAGPGHHGVGVGIVEHDAAGQRHLADVLAEIQHGRDAALAVHDAADAQRIAHALIHAVLERNFHVRFKALEHADAHAVDDILRISESLAPVERGLNADIQSVGLDIALAQLRDHAQVVGIDIGESHLNIPEFRNGEQIGEQPARKSDASRANESDLKRHSNTSRVIFCVHLGPLLFLRALL